MTKLYFAFALVLSFAASQPAHADQAVGQMIDDSGLVISSYADGSIREFNLSKYDMASLKMFQHNNISKGLVLQDADLVVMANK